MSEDNDHTKTLIEARELLISRRRALAVALVKDPEHMGEFVGIQDAINAIEEAIKQERLLLSVQPEAMFASHGHNGPGGARARTARACEARALSSGDYRGTLFTLLYELR